MSWRSVIFAACALLQLPALAVTARAEDHQRLELWLSGGAYRLDAAQDLGGFEQLAVSRSGVQGATLAAFDLRAAYCPVPRLCLAALGELIPGELGGSAALGLGYRAELLVHLLMGRLRPFVTLTGGGLTLLSPASVLGTDTDPTAGWGVGAKLRLGGGRFLVRLDLSHLVTDGRGDPGVAHNLLLTAGVGLGLLPRPLRRPPPFDRDGDGLVGRRDRCPDQAEDPDGFADDDGCPDDDNDGDGVPDHLDLCPNQRGPAPRGCSR